MNNKLKDTELYISFNPKSSVCNLEWYVDKDTMYKGISPTEALEFSKRNIIIIKRVLGSNLLRIMYEV